MEKILSQYQRQVELPSDINEHLPTLKKYAHECEHITEMGVRTGVSIWALLAAKPLKLIAYDVVKDPGIDQIERCAKDCNINFQFEKKDVLKIEIEKTDLLFIDTLHTYEQLRRELNLHADKVRKYIILHDTITFGERGEQVYSHASDIARSDVSGKGLKYALAEFLDANNKWRIKEAFANNNGLTVLERISE